MSKSLCVAATVILTCCAAVSHAESPQDGAVLEQRPVTSPHTHRQAADTSVGVQRVSEILGMNVISPNEETIGEVEDLVLGSRNGEVRYAAVSVGGFLGIGDKLVAVPWRAFQTTTDEDGNTYLVLNTSKEALEAAPGFDEEHWPDFANRSGTTDNDRHFKLDIQVGR